MNEAQLPRKARSGRNECAKARRSERHARCCLTVRRRRLLPAVPWKPQPHPPAAPRPSPLAPSESLRRTNHSKLMLSPSKFHRNLDGIGGDESIAGTNGSVLRILRTEDDGQHSRVDRGLASPWTMVPTKMLRKTNAPSQTQETTKIVTTKEGRPAAALRSVYTTCVRNGLLC